MLIDFTPVRDHELTYFKLGQRLTVADLKAATHASLDRILEILGDATDAEAIRDWANERLAKHQRLAAVEFRDEFPRNALGKVIKRVLREELTRRQAAR